MSKFKPRRRASAAPSPAATITAAIVARLEAGVKPWVRPWRCAASSRPLRACGTPYRGINVFWLWLVADCHGYRSPQWMTYRQAQALGGQVRKGELSSIAVFYKSMAPRLGEGGSDERPDPGVDHRDSDGDRRQLRRVLKSYAVFNADQIDGLPDRFSPVAEDDATPVEPTGRDAALDGFFAAIPAVLRHHGDQAYYEPPADRVTMPPAMLFRGYDHYYATLAHELSHWTGHGARLARDLKHRFGTSAYAAEELIAELSAAMLGAELGLPVAHLDHHASYIDHWLTLLRSDDRAILTAAARAEEASDLLLRLGGRRVAEAGEGARDDRSAGEGRERERG
jgi:antirestriction protein ArdC